MKPTITFVFPDCVGGVASFNRNIINNSTLKSYFTTRVVLLQAREDSRVKFLDLIEADEVVHFTFSNTENKYFVSRRLKKIIGDDPGCIVTDNDWTLRCIVMFGSKKKLFYLVHDYFYINWALQYANCIDSVVAHSSFFLDILLAADINKFQSKVQYLTYGVEQATDLNRDANILNPLNLVFLGRLVESKGVLQLKKIEDALSFNGIEVNWTIIGVGPLKTELVKTWETKKNIQFIEATNTHEVYSILEKQDVLVFPSKFEGTPVSIMEAMSRGVVPVVSDLPGGTRDMVTNEIGFRCNPNDDREFVDAVKHLHMNREFLLQLQEACFNRSKEQYDIEKAANRYFSFFINKFENGSSEKKGENKVKLNFLDKPYFPNRLVCQIRKFREAIR